VTGTDEDSALADYEKLRARRPELFVNEPGTAFEIVFDPELQQSAGAGVMYQDSYITLVRDAVRFRNGIVGAYVRLIPAADHGGAAVLPVAGDDIILIRHQRHATRTSHWEIPRGFAAKDEHPRETARREITEELEAADPELIELGGVHPDTGASSNITMLYLARLSGTGRVETDEGIDQLRRVTPGEFDDMVLAGEITDSFTLAAVLQARLRGLLR
jgi:ADP-ribose pyrophosphatase